MKNRNGFQSGNNPRLLTAAVALCAGGMLAGSGQALAQTKKPELDTSLEEVIVQAQRKSELVQDVPVSIVAITGESLQNQGLATIKGLDNLVPNAVIEHVSLFPRAASLSMRGVGYAGIESFTDPEVAVYVNGVYQARNAIALSSSLDLSTVEVLRGPQGTLYGRNALAGAVAIHTNLPELDGFKGKASFTVGNYGRQDSEIMANIPFTDTTAFRVAARLHNLDGYYHNNGIIDASGHVDQSLKGQAIGGEHNLYIRPTFLFEPSDDFQMVFYGEIYRDRSDPNPTVLGPLDGNLLASLGWKGANPFGDKSQGVSGDGSDPYSTGNSIKGRPNDVDSYSLTNETTYSTQYGDIKGIFNYQYAVEDIWTNTDGSNVNAFASARWQDYSVYSGEIQYLGTLFDKLDVTAGVFYLHDHYQTTQLSFTDFSAPFVDEFTPYTVNPSYINNEGKRNSISAYAQFEYHLTEDLSFVAGGRYSYEKKYGARGENTSLSAAGIDPGTDFSKHIWSDVPGVIFGPISEDWDNFAPRLGVNYRVSPDILVFGFWQKAFKSGGFNANSSDQSAFNTPYGEEEVDNYEIGMKSDWLDGRLRVNANIFYSEFSGLQRSLVTPSPTAASGVTTVTTNVADLRSYGFETEISALLMPGFSVFANIGWDKAEYTSYCADLDGAESSTTPANGGKVCGPITQVGSSYLVPTDYSNLKPIRAPRWDVTTGFNKKFLFDAGAIDWNGRVNYRSDMYTNLLNVKYSYRPSMTTIDSSLTWTPEKGNYTVTLWGNNLTNKIEIMNYLPVSTLFAAINPTDPRTFGVTLSLDF